MSKSKYIGGYSINLKIGIIGTTNVGKSTLFNLLSRSNINTALCSPSLFCTADPNITIFETIDLRFDFISSICKPQIESRSKITLIDTAGLVDGSFNEKNGLGVSSLQCLRKADMLIHLLRDFKDTNICHYHSTVDAVRDLNMVNQELLLMDLHLLEQALMEVETIIMDRAGGEHLQYQHNTLLLAWACVAGEERPVPPDLAAAYTAAATGGARPKKGISKFRRNKLPKVCKGKAIRFGAWDHHQQDLLAQYNLLTAKEVLYVANISSRDFLRGRGVQHIVDAVAADHAAKALAKTIALTDALSLVSSDNSSVHSSNSVYSRTKSMKNEVDLSQITEMTAISLSFEQYLRQIELGPNGAEEIAEYFTANPTHISANNTIFSACYHTLGLVRFYTQSEKEVKCYLLRLGSTVLDASALVDVQMMRNLIRADVISFEDYSHHRGDRLAILMAGKLKSETRKYVVNDGDVVEFFFHEYPNVVV